MQAVVYKEPYEVAVEEVDEARLEGPNDALLRVTSTAICGSDLHMYEGRSIFKGGEVLGHEIMGVIEEVGPGVVSISPGDRVVLPFNISCGVCMNCTAGYMSACLITNPETPGASYGYPGMGPYRGGQAEMVRVPFADYNCLKLPGRPGDDFEHDFLMLADIFPTAYHATELAMVQPGKTVAIWGAGPVGLLAAYSSILKGAAAVFVVDRVPERLERAAAIGAMPVNFDEGDPVEQILELRRKPEILEALRPGEEKMPGVMCSIDAVGYQNFDREDPPEQAPPQVIEDLVRVTNPTGAIGIIGVYTTKDPGHPDPHGQKGEYMLPLGKIFEKGLTIGGGQTPVKKYNVYLRDLIIADKAKPSFIISHRLPLADAPDAYQHFDQREDGYTKVVLEPNAA